MNQEETPEETGSTIAMPMEGTELKSYPGGYPGPPSTSPATLQEELYSCQICCEEFHTAERQPKALPCLHTFCLACLKKYSESEGATEEGQYFFCPNCRSKVFIPEGGVEAFVNNFLIDKFREIHGSASASSLKPSKSLCEMCQDDDDTAKDATFHCYDCNVNLCLECKKEHLEVSVNTSHKVELLQKDSVKCFSHPNKDVSHYCKIHTALVCVKCVQKSHKQCSLTAVEKFTLEQPKELKSLVDKGKQKLDTLRKDLSSSDEKLKELHGKDIKLQQEIMLNKANIEKEKECKKSTFEEVTHLNALIDKCNAILSCAPELDAVQIITELQPLQHQVKCYLETGTFVDFDATVEKQSDISKTSDAGSGIPMQSVFPCKRDIKLPTTLKNTMPGKLQYGVHSYTISATVHDVAVAPTGHIAFVDTSNRQVVIFDEDNNVTGLLDNDLHSQMLQNGDKRLLSGICYFPKKELFGIVLRAVHKENNWLGQPTSSKNYHVVQLCDEIGIVRDYIVLQASPTMSCPSGISVGESSDIAITHMGRDAVYIFDYVGNQLKVIGSSGTALTQFYTPTYIVMDTTGEWQLFVSDTGNNTVKALDINGRFYYGFPNSNQINDDYTKSSRSSSDCSSVFEASSTSESSDIPDEKMNSKVSNASPEKMESSLHHPKGICKHQNLLIVCDSGNNKVKLFSLTGQFIKTLAEVPCPRAVCMGPYDTMVVSYGFDDGLNHGFKVFDLSAIAGSEID